MKVRTALIIVLPLVVIAAFAFTFCRKEPEDIASASQPKKTSTIPAGPVSGRPESPKPAKPEKAKLPENEKRAPVEELTPEQEEREAAKKAFTMFKWMTSYALDHGGSYPPDLSALLNEDLGFPMDQTGIDYLRHVIEYRGRDLTNSDEGRRLLMRYRIGKRTDKEVRLHVSGSANVVAADTPIPEDAPVEEPR